MICLAHYITIRWNYIFGQNLAFVKEIVCFRMVKSVDFNEVKRKDKNLQTKIRPTAFGFHYHTYILTNAIYMYSFWTSLCRLKWIILFF